MTIQAWVSGLFAISTLTAYEWYYVVRFNNQNSIIEYFRDCHKGLFSAWFIY